jgi:hypothetical protein
MNELKVDVLRRGRRFEAEALLELAADVQTVWDTITDYDALPGFMPGIRACRVLERRALTSTTEHLLVEQQGEFRLLLFAQSMTVTLSIEQQRPRVATAKALSVELGILRRRAIDVFEGRYELTARGAHQGVPRTRLRYTAVIGLRLPPPPAVGSLAVRQNLSAQLQAVGSEVARRSGRTASASVAS